MPIYEYRCKACEEELEVLRKISDPPLEKCPACGQLALKKKVSAAAFRLKGGGWYETDFKTGDKKNIAGTSDGAASGGAGGSGTAGKSDAEAPRKSSGETASKSDSASKSDGAGKSGGGKSDGAGKSDGKKTA